MYVRGVIWMFADLPLFPASLRAGAATWRANEGDGHAVHSAAQRRKFRQLQPICNGLWKVIPKPA